MFIIIFKRNREFEAKRKEEREIHIEVYYYY
jgi:hypothetical protein